MLILTLEFQRMHRWVTFYEMFRLRKVNPPLSQIRFSVQVQGYQKLSSTALQRKGRKSSTSTYNPALCWDYRQMCQTSSVILLWDCSISHILPLAIGDKMFALQSPLYRVIMVKFVLRTSLCHEYTHTAHPCHLNPTSTSSHTVSITKLFSLLYKKNQIGPALE